jgi:hypothetical protein
MKKFRTVKRALEWLESQEPAEIMDVLEDHPGKRNKKQECPLARWCRFATGTRVSVQPKDRLPFAGYGVRLDAGAFYPLGSKLRSFVTKFDDGDYPHLVSRTP